MLSPKDRSALLELHAMQFPFGALYEFAHQI